LPKDSALTVPTTKDRGAERFVAVIDDDESVREALCGLFQSVGLSTKIFGSVQAFIDANGLELASCIVLDIRLPGRSGLEYLEALAKSAASPSVVLISGHVDVQLAVRAMKAGAVDVLTKPVREQDLLEAVNRGVARDQHRRDERALDEALRARQRSLSERERQIFDLVAAGLLNKQIAERVSITEATVKLHRGQVMKKMGADSLPDLVRMADRLAKAEPGDEP
jgi:FixJ family two-component response regulator